MSAPCPTYGFTVALVPRDGASADALDALRDDLAAMLAAHGLETMRGSARALEYVVVRDGSQAADADRTLVRAWAEQWTDVAEVRISEIVDLGA